MTYYYYYKHRQLVDAGAYAGALEANLRRRRDDENVTGAPVEAVKALAIEAQAEPATVQSYSSELQADLEAFMNTTRQLSALQVAVDMAAAAAARAEDKERAAAIAVARDAQRRIERRRAIELERRAEIAARVLEMQEEEQLLLYLLLN